VQRKKRKTEKKNEDKKKNGDKLTMCKNNKNAKYKEEKKYKKNLIKKTWKIQFCHHYSNKYGKIYNYVIFTGKYHFLLVYVLVI